MKTNKLKDFTKKYGFYLAVGFVSIGAITAVVLTQDRGATEEVGKVPQEQVQEVSGKDVGLVLEEKEKKEKNTESVSEKIVSGEIVGEEALPTKEEEMVTGEPVGEVAKEEEMVSETFNSTTVVKEEKPYFAEGDTLIWPVGGEVIVPFRDDTTKHWFSTALQQTMRTYGICISAKEGEGIKAPAKGTVVDIIEDSTTLDSTKLVGNVGQVIIMDLGNGYTAQIGIQGGKANKELLGQVVNASDVIGTVGNGTGPFADLSYNVYMQVTKNNEIIDPTTMLSYHENVAGVDMGHEAE